jgi:hypothetical protein
MFIVVRGPEWSLRAKCTPLTHVESLQLVASGEREAELSDDICDYTEWRLFADSNPSPEEIIATCEVLLTPSIQFVFLYPNPNAEKIRRPPFSARRRSRPRRTRLYSTLTKVYGPTKDGRLTLYSECPFI